MAGLVPAIHAFCLEGAEDVDARHKAGHDGGESMPTTQRRLRLYRRLAADQPSQLSQSAGQPIACKLGKCTRKF